MKPKFALLFVLVAAFALISCSEKDLYDEDRIEKKITDLNIPANFDWKLISNVNCDFSASAKTPIAVYTAKACDENSLIAEYTLEPNMEAISLPVAKYVTKLYVKAGDGNAIEVPVINGSATFAAPTSRNSPILPGDYEEGDEFAYVYFPSKCGVATVMFEDNFPIEGDYDFNDFVANYSYIAKLSKQQGGGSDPSKFHVVSLEFSVKVKALGGLYEYTPYLRVYGMKVDNKNGFSGDGATIMTGKDKDPIVRIDGHTKKPQGAQYLNTKLEDPIIIPKCDLKVVKFTINANNNGGTGVKQEDLQFDFYLKGVGHLGGTYEIHQKGFEPIDKACYPNDYPGLGSTRYTTNKNLVWGITIPAYVKHTIECADFLKAYPGFEAWVTRATEEQRALASNWHENGNDDYLFTVPEE